MWKSEDNFWKTIFSHCVGRGVWTLFFSLGGKCSFTLSFLINPNSFSLRPSMDFGALAVFGFHPKIYLLFTKTDSNNYSRRLKVCTEYTACMATTTAAGSRSAQSTLHTRGCFPCRLWMALRFTLWILAKRLNLYHNTSSSPSLQIKKNFCHVD